MENENKLMTKTDQDRGLAEAKKLSRKAIEQFKVSFRTSLEKLKEYGVKYDLIDKDTPLEEVRQKLLEKIKELDERKGERRVGEAGSAEERRRSKNRRQS